MIFVFFIFFQSTWKRCRMLQTIFWLFQCSKNTRWVVHNNRIRGEFLHGWSLIRKFLYLQFQSVIIQYTYTKKCLHINYFTVIPIQVLSGSQDPWVLPLGKINCCLALCQLWSFPKQPHPSRQSYEYQVLQAAIAGRSLKKKSWLRGACLCCLNNLQGSITLEIHSLCESINLGQNGFAFLSQLYVPCLQKVVYQ